jgi:hypothetical protein
MASSNAQTVLDAMSVVDEPEDADLNLAYALLKVLADSGTDGSEGRAVADVIGQLEGIIGAGHTTKRVEKALSEWADVEA